MSEAGRAYWAEHMVCGYCHATILRADYFGSHGRTCHGLTGPIDLDAMLAEIGFDPSTVPHPTTRDDKATGPAGAGEAGGR